ncbi:UNVERIFIED_CONTAM: cytochrome c oxidase assembly protein [Halobacillus marinus]|uniref:cytochrome c oxidase assembly protein n=1 Tax=Bacillaceae TaxID=186817 RepID=UPI0002A50CF9|nr:MULTISPECIES: cytochrome c oxidase assembly protein [Bacillaceae]ELK46683.1 cytochrome c oxidase assembly protein Sco [Halobacillus sp. BAB-2008]QHT45305.1 cytochrome c oxidase assembly protein [Bacillus sp. SB49]
MKRRLFIFVLFVAVPACIFVACGSKQLEDTLDIEVQSFEGKTQEGKAFSTEEMKGKVWLADFVFTSCDTDCPPLTRNMSEVQQQLKQEGIDAEIVTFSVDPTVDTPDKLKEFALKNGASLDNWTFVTEYTQEQIADFAQESFQTPAVKTEGNDQVTHSNAFYLVGKNGKVLKKYKGDVAVPKEQILKDIKAIT